MLDFHPAQILVTSKNKHGYYVLLSSFVVKMGVMQAGGLCALALVSLWWSFLLDSDQGAVASKGNWMKMAGNMACPCGRDRCDQNNMLLETHDWAMQGLLIDRVWGLGKETLAGQD